jgi:nucleotide-binding universal stress UspA family protein
MMTVTNLPRPLNILLAFDGSQHSVAAINLLRDLPLDVNSTITTVGVLIPRESSNHAIMESALEQANHLLKDMGFNAYTEMVLGSPAEKLIEYAENLHPDLIVAGAKGLRHTLGILLGGVAQQIVEYAHQPVLVVRAPYKKLKHILLVTDGSPASQTAINYLAGSTADGETQSCEAFPFPIEADLRIMHVLPPLPSPELIARSWPIGPDLLPPAPIDRESEISWAKEEEDRGSEILENALRFISKCTEIDPTPVLARGDAATEILQYIKEHEIDMVIAGSRGLSEMRAWLLGSVSRKLVHYAACSVMIVKHG